MKLFTAKGLQALVAIVAVSDAAGEAEQQVLDNIARYASSELSTIITANYQIHRAKYIMQLKK